MLDSAQRALEMICHLLVSGLAPLGNLGENIFGDIELPGLETLLARGARTRVGHASLEDWLMTAFDLAGADPAVAPYALYGEGYDPGQHGWLCADPVHLQLRSARVIMADPSQIAVAAHEATQWVESLNAHFSARALTFFAPTPNRWYVRAARAPELRTTPTSAVAGREITPFLPTGNERAFWLGVLNEAQMVLHAHPCNAEREQRGQLPVNSLWFWGAGAMAARAPKSRYHCIWSDHPLATGLGRLSNADTRPFPASGMAALDAVAGGNRPEDFAHLVVLPGLSLSTRATADGFREALLHLEELWFVPLLAGLGKGVVSAIALDAVHAQHGWTLTVTRQNRFRFWRRRKRLSEFGS